MSNEELAERIQNGEKEYISILWQQTENFFRKNALQFYNRYKEKCISFGLAYDDLYQESYFAFVKGLESFKPKSGYKFLTFAMYHLKNQFYFLLGFRGKKYFHEPLNSSVSFEKETGEDIKLEDMLEDETAASSMEQVEKDLYNQSLRTALEKSFKLLTEKQESSIKKKYFEGETLRKIAEERKVKYTAVNSEIKEGFRKLRRCIYLQEYAEDIKTSQRMYHTGFTVWYQSGSSPQEYALLMAEREAEWIKKQWSEETGGL